MWAKVVFFALLLGNLAAGVGLLMGFGSGQKKGEPERLTSQLEAHRLKLKDDILAGERAMSPETPLIREGSTHAAVREAPLPPPDLPTCLLFDSMSAEQRQVAEIIANRHNARMKQSASGQPSAWWLNVPPQPDRATAEKKMLEIRGRGFADLFIVPEGGANRNAISLGLFKTESAARQRMDAMIKQGVSGLQITPRGGSLAYQVEIRGDSEVIAIFSRAWAEQLPDVKASFCQ